MSRQDWMRVDRQIPCPICEKPDWCLISVDRTAAICARVEDGCKRHIGEAGWLHQLVENDRKYAIPYIHVKKQKKKPVPPPNWSVLSEEYKSRAADISALSEQLGVSEESLRKIGVGKTEKGGWTFPMYDERCGVIGYRIRSNTGRKWAYPGSRNGLFLPDHFKEAVYKDHRDHDETGALIVVCEGPTDVAAMSDVGFVSIGRPSCTGGVDLLTGLLSYLPARIVIVSDSDGPGKKGAAALLQRMKDCSIKCAMFHPPFRKDAREWVTSVGPRTVRIQMNEMAVGR